MRCTCYCTASAYNFSLLQQHLQKEGLTQSYRDFLHRQSYKKDGSVGDIFYFSYGAVVIWGLNKDEEKKVLKELRPFEDESFPQAELDEFTFCYSDEMKVEEDVIYLHNKSPMTKIAISHSLAQSVKLANFEEIIHRTFQDTKKIPENLAKKGKIPLSRKEISRKMGELFIERNFINLHTEVLDTPEFFWEYPELETFYRRIAHYLDINRRVEVLNKRLSVVHELFQILSHELNHQYSLRLEWTIIILILIEVMIALLRDVFRII